MAQPANKNGSIKKTHARFIISDPVVLEVINENDDLYTQALP